MDEHQKQTPMTDITPGVRREGFAVIDRKISVKKAPVRLSVDERGSVPASGEIDATSEDLSLGSSSTATVVVPNPVASNVPTPQAMYDGHNFAGKGSKKRIILTISAWMGVFVLISAIIFAVVSSRSNDENAENKVQPITSIPKEDLLSASQKDFGTRSEVTINGPLQVKNKFTISPSEKPLNPQAGQIYFDGKTKQFVFYDGEGYQTLITNQLSDQFGSLSRAGPGTGLSLSGTQLNNSGVLSIQGQSGNLTITGGPGLVVNGLQLANTGVLSVQGTAGNVVFSGGAGIAVNGTQISNTGVLSVVGTANQVSVSTAGGVVTVSLPQNISTNSSPLFNGLNLTNALSVANGGTGSSAINFVANGSVYYDGTRLVSTSAPASAGLCLISTAGAPAFGTCPGSSASIGGSGTPGAIPYFDSANTIADSIMVQSGSTVTVAGTLDATFLVGDGSSVTNVDATALSGQGSAYYRNASNINSGILATAYGGTGLATTPANGQLLIGNGSGYSLGTIGNGGGLTVTNGVGTISVAVNYGSTANTSAEGDKQITVTAGTNLTGGGVVTIGAGGTLTLNVASSPTFSGNLSVQGGSATLGTVSQAGSLVLNDGAGNIGTLQVASLGQGTIYTLPDPGVATATICLTTNNCVGPNGGGVTSTGTANKLVIFSGGAYSLADSIVTQSSGLITVDGNLSATALQGNGAGLTDLDAGNITTGILSIARGGTGISLTPNNGQLLIGNGTGYSLATITNADGTVEIVTGPGSIQISVPRADQCATCADYTLSNLADVIAINKSLLPASAGSISLGGAGLPYQYLYLSGDEVANPGSNYFTITGDASAQRTITLPDASGIVCLDNGNCAGAGGGIVGSSAGTTGYLPVYTGSYTIADSIVSQSLGVLSVGGNLNVSGNVSITNGLTVTNNISAASFNNLTLTALADGFSLLGGTTSRTLTVQGSNITLNQSLQTTDTPNFSGLTLSNSLGVAYGGTGILGGPTANGQLLIGSSTGNYTRATLTAGSGIVITNSAGGITVAAPTAGTCTSGCADQSLSNLAAININTSLLPNSGNTVSLGSLTRPFQSIRLNSTAGAQGFNITGTNATGTEVTIALPVLNGTVALVQTAGSSTTQNGDLNIGGNIIGNRLISGLVGTDDGTSSSNVMLRSGNASSGNSGNVSIDSGSASGTAGTISIATVNASGLTLGRAGVQVSIPGGLNTQGSDIVSQNGNLNLGTGSITSGNINGQTISSSANFTGTVLIQGADALTLGTSGANTGAIIFRNLNGSNSVKLKASDLNPGSDITFTLPNALPGSTECVTLSATGQFGSQNCSGGLTGSGSDGTFSIFTSGGTALTDSILSQSSNTLTIQGSSSNLVVSGGTSGGLGNNSISLGTASSRTGGINFYNESNANVASIVSGTSANSYTLILPTDLDTTGKCLNVGAGGQIGYFSCVSSGGGGGTGVTGSGTTDRLVRWTDGGLSVVGDSVVRDNGTRVGIGIAPDATAVFVVGSSGAFKVTNAGALTSAGITNSSGGIDNSSSGITNTGAISGATSVSASGLISTSANNQALTLSGAPTNSATQSLLQIGSAIVGGNTSANGGTYIGLNAPNSGAGSVADLINLQKNGVSLFRVATTGAVTAGTYNSLSLQANATGFQVAGGTASRQLTVTANATIDQNLAVGSNVSFGTLTLSTALSPANGGTGIAGGPTADGQLLIGSAGGTYTRSTLTAGSGINISNASGSITISSPSAGSCSTCADRQLSNLTGTTAIPVDLLPSSAGTINIGSDTAPFNSLYVGTDGNAFRITGTATSDQTVTLFDAGGPSEICVKYNGGANSNCSGTGGGITGSGAGTSGTIPVYTGSYSIADSILSQSAGVVSVAGGLSATGGVNFSSTLAVTNAVTGGTFNGLTLTSASDGFTINGGTTPRTLTVQGANVSINQSLLTSSNVTFAGVTASGNLSITGTSTLTGAVTASSIAPPASTAFILGANGAGQTTNLQGSTITFTNGARTYGFNSVASGSHTICDSSGNCASAGGGVTTVGGTLNKLAKFSGSQTIVDSVFSDDGTNGTISGSLSIQGTTLSGSGALTVASTGGANNLTLNSGSGTIIFGANTFQRTATGGVTFDLVDVNPTTFTVTNSHGTGVANLSVEGSGTFGAGVTSTGGVVNLNASSNNATNINTGTSTGAVAIGNSATSSLTIESGTGTTSLFNGATAHTINFATGAASQSITIGSINTTSLTKIQGGATGSVSIGAVLAETNSSTVNIANTSNATGTQTVRIGSTANSANSTILQSGSTNGVIVRSDGTTGFRVQNASGSTTIFTVDSTNSIVTIGSATGSLTGRDLVVADLDVTTSLRVGNGTNGVSFNDATSGKFRLSGTARNSKKLLLTAEYAGLVLDPDGSNNIGSATSAFDATQRESYYNWSTTQATNQDYDFVVQVPLPSDFDGLDGSNPITIDRWTSNTTNGTITATLLDTAGSAVINWNSCSLTPGSSSTWTTTTGCSISTGTFTADGVITLRIKLQAPQNGNTRIGNITINYLSKF